MKKTYVPSDLLALCTLPAFTFRQFYTQQTKPGGIFS